MGQVRQDNVQIKLEIDGSQSRTELDNLTRKAQLLQDGLKGLKKGSEEYVAANKELSQVNARMKELRDEIGLTSLTTGQLKTLAGQLNRELAQLTPNTASFANKAQELANVEARLAQVRTEAKGVKDGFDDAGGSFSGFLKKVVAFSGIQLGVGAVVSGLKELGESSVAEFQQAAGAAAQLDATITSTGNSAGFTRQQLLDMSTALEGKTFFDGDAITQQQSVLLGFQNIKGSVYKDALPAIADMAVKLAGDGEADLTGATRIVGKALENPLAGIAKLTKAGVDFPAGATEMVQGLLAINDVAGAQRVILDALSAQYGGSAEAAAKAGTGPLKQFEVAIGNVKEGLGELILDGLTALQPALSAGLQLFGFFIELLKATPAFLSENKAALIGLAVAIVTLNAEQVMLNTLVLAQSAIEKGRAAATLASATAQRLLNAAMSANPIGLVIAAVALLAGGLVTLYERSEKVREVVAGLGAAAVQVFKNIKEAFLLNLAGLSDVLAGLFTFDPERIKKGLEELGGSVAKTFTGLGDGVAGAYYGGYAEREKAEQAAQAARDAQQQQAKVQRARAAADKTAADAAKANLEALKDREANIKAALALVAAGSAEELRLKKLEVTTKRDIDLLGEKKTAGDKKVIRAEALRDLRQLQDEYDKKSKEAADKRAKEQADVAKKIADLKSGLLKDETEKRIQQLTAAAEKEKATAAGTAAQIAEQRRLIDQKLAVDIAAERKKQADKQADEELDVEKRKNALLVNEFDRRAAELRTAAAADTRKVLDTDSQAAEKRRLIQVKLQADLVTLEQARVAQQREIADRILAIDEDIALRRIARRRQTSERWSQEQAQADTDEQAVRRAQLDRQYGEDLFQQGLSNEQKLAISRQYLADKEALEQEYADRSRERDKAGAEFGLEAMSTAVQTIADFQKIASDKELAKVDSDKKKRLASLEAEYKAGTLSKDQYEAQKSAIEASYDAKTRAIKKDAAEKEKELNIAQAVIQTALSVVKASPNVPLMIAAGITGAASIAKIVATPIPEFAQGGVVGGPKPTWREKVRQFAHGGRINSRAGVADVGQRHSGGGIRMVDGATGEHLGEWERGEPYLILSRDTYANNKHLVDELLDTSLYRGGAPVRRKPGFFEEGGLTGGATPRVTGGANTDGQELLQAVNRVENAVRALPSRQYIGWDQDDTAELEQRLDERADDRAQGQIR